MDEIFRSEHGVGKPIKNIEKHTWRSMRCDYCHEVGVDSFSKLEDLPKSPSGSIQFTGSTPRNVSNAMVHFVQRLGKV